MAAQKMQRYALLDGHRVINVVLWDGDAERWSPPVGIQARALPDDSQVAAGWGWDGTACVFVPPAPEPVHTPPAITDRQIRLALNQMGLRDAVEAAVAAGGRDLQDWWDRSLEIHRDHPLVVQMIAALGVSEAQADALWVLGAGL